MTTINLRDYYPDYYNKETYIEVSDEVAAFFAEEKRLQTNYAQYIRDNKALYSLDADDGIENDALQRPEQPDEALERRELTLLLSAALNELPEVQRRRVLAHVVLELQMTDIAEAEKVDKSSVSESVSRGLANLRKILKSFSDVPNFCSIFLEVYER